MERDSLIPEKNDEWMGCVGQLDCLVYMEGQYIPRLL